MEADKELIYKHEPGPIVVLACRAIDCRFNLARTPTKLMACNLKYLAIDEAGKCTTYEAQVGNAN